MLQLASRRRPRAASPEHLGALRAAARDHERIEIEYVAASTGAWTARRIEPEEVFSSLGNWYVVAWDVEADAERLFRADRVDGRRRERASRSTPEDSKAPAAPSTPPRGDDVPVRLRLRPAARWIGEYYATTETLELEDGELEVTLPARQLGWVARLLLRVGPDAEVVAPPELADEVRELGLSHARSATAGDHPGVVTLG